MKRYTLTQNAVKGALLVWVLLVAVLALSNTNPLGVLWFLGIPLLFVLPGSMLLLFWRNEKIDIWERLVLSVGLSTVVLLVVGCIMNFVLPYLGVQRPLDTLPVVMVLTSLLLVGIASVWKRINECVLILPQYVFASTFRDLAYVLIPPVLACVIVLGALRLNNGESNFLTVAALVTMAVYAFLLYRNAERLGKHVVQSGLFFIGLALLLMTSLRGWFISGHDVQREFFVFQLTKDAGLWSVAAYQDAYNACLSITILPTMLANVLHVADTYVFKLVMQCTFALAPVVTYLISRRWFGIQLSFLAGLLFMSFPTYFQDMPYLVRQEVAFLFYGLMVYLVVADHLSVRFRRILFLVCGVGIVLSHYATTYTVLFVLGLAVCTIPILFRLFAWLRTRSWVPETPLGQDVEKRTERKNRIVTIRSVLMLAMVAIIWTSVITGTDRHVRSVSTEIWSAVREGVGDGSRSADVLLLFSFGRVVDDRTLDDYIENVVAPHRALHPGRFMATSTYAAYPVVTLPPTELPTTPIGSIDTGLGFNLKELVTYLGQLLAKVMQMAIIFGLVAVLVSGAYLKRMNSEFYVLSGFMVFFVLLCIVVPILSLEYGLFRALQQSMFALAPFMVLGAVVVGRVFVWLFHRWYHLLSIGKGKVYADDVYIHNVAGTLSALFLLYATGVMTHFVGGNLPPVHLYNVGDDYKHYIVEPAEHAAIQWLSDERERVLLRTGEYPQIQTDRYGQKKLNAYFYEGVTNHTHPGLIARDSYIFVTPAMQFSRTAMAYHEGVTIKYAYPLEFLDANKNLVYDNGSVRIYR